MSLWQRHSIEARIHEILVSIPRGDHHFGRPFLSAYQIAITFRQRYPQEADLIAKPVGGRDTGRHDSLTEYFANQFSQRILNDSLPGIEGRFSAGDSSSPLSTTVVWTQSRPLSDAPTCPSSA